MRIFFFFSSRRRHTRWNCDWSSDVCSSDLKDKPTDVLAFAQQEGPTAAPDVLGDLVISMDTARRQAKRGLYAELLHLARSEERRVGKECRCRWSPER